MGISKMCKRLKDFAAEQAPQGRATNTRFMRPSFIINKRAYYIIGNSIKGAPRSNGKPNPPRKCTTLPVETLRQYATAMGIDPTGKSKPKLCAEMQTFRAVEPVNALRKRFIEAMGNKSYTESNINYYKSLPTPQKRAAYIVRMKRGQ
jgi:hypothetical protein